jgi:glycosyltransferase involved in cell wall biosynthesis
MPGVAGLPSVPVPAILARMKGYAGTLAVIVPAWNEAAEIPRTLAALDVAARIFDEVRTAVVAGGSDDAMAVAEEAVRRHPSLQGRVLCQRPLGKMAALADGMAWLAERPPADWVLTLDADTWLMPDALEGAVRSLEDRHDLSGVGARLLLGPAGVGAAHDLVQGALVRRRRQVPAVPGHAIFLRGDVVWNAWQDIFAPHDYPLHVDYQMCERVRAACHGSFAYANGFSIETPRARGWGFLRAERRHHRAMVARGRWRCFRYLAGACINCTLPLVPFVTITVAPHPVLWPLGLVSVAFLVRRVHRWLSDYRTATEACPDVSQVSFRRYVMDEWVFSLAAVLGALDFLVERTPAPTFQGARRRSPSGLSTVRQPSR